MYEVNFAKNTINEENLKNHDSPRQYYTKGWAKKTPIANTCYALYVLWALAETLLARPQRVKYLFMEPITRIYVAIGDPLAILLVPYEWITPNMISYFHVCLGICTFFLIITPNWNYRRFGVLLYTIRSILDSTDGALARARAAQGHWNLPSEEQIIDIDFVCDTTSAILYGAAIVVYFLRNEKDLIAQYDFYLASRVFVVCVTTIFLKGFIMDSVMEYYEESGIEPSLLVAFLWKISSYDSWDNLKLFALLSVTEFKFYMISSGWFVVPWVGIPTLLSVLELYQIF